MLLLRLIGKFMLVAGILFCVFCEEVLSECPAHNTGSHGFSMCSNGKNHKSICETKCKTGFRLKGPSRMMCWCKNGKCKWTGKRASCERMPCKVPNTDAGFVKIVDSWDNGFAGLIEIQNIVPTSDSEFGWSIVVIFDRPLGEAAKITTWNLELTAVSYDGQAFTFVNSKRNAKLSEFLKVDNLLSVLFIVENTGENPGAAYVGMYQKRVRDATCLAATKMPEIRSVYNGTYVKGDAPKSTTLSDNSNRFKVNGPPKSTSTTKRPGTEPPKTTNSTKRTTTRKPMTTKLIKPATTRKPQTHIQELTTSSNVPKTSAPIKLSTSMSVSSITTVNTADQIIPAGDYCVLQNHEMHYTTDDGWEDGGRNFFSGNIALRYPSDLPDWSMVVVFEEAVDNIETWACRVLDNSEDGFIWTFGPHPWNTKLHGGESDIRFIATQAYATVKNPSAQVYLCSNTFTTGDAVMSNPNKKPVSAVSSQATTRSPLQAFSQKQTAPQTTTTTLASERCSANAPNGRPVIRANQIKLNFKENNDGTKYNYNELLHKSILFYEAQRSGQLPDTNRIPWRGDSALKDGCDIGADLTGGWYDAGDNVKFNFPMAYSLTVLAWGGIEFRDAYKDAGELDNMIDSIIWTTKYFIKTHISKYELVGQVGHGQTDHNYWGRPEQMNMKRPTYIISAKKPGTELAAEVSAALAASSIFIRPTHQELADEALQHANEIYELADKYRGTYHFSIPDVSRYYKSYSGYQDELLWASAWLYRATNDSSYLQAAIKFHDRMGGRNAVGPVFSWDNKLAGAQALLAKLTGKVDFRVPLVKHLDSVQRIKQTPHGLMFYSEWGTNRYAANAALLAVMGANLNPPLPRHKAYLNWAKKQMGLIFGDDGRSYVVGFGDNPPKRAHHSSSNCPPYPERCDWTTYHSPKPNHYILYGAIVGGPNEKGVYGDNRGMYEETEVACDYNAGYQSAVAGLKHFAMKIRQPVTTTTIKMETTSIKALKSPVPTTSPKKTTTIKTKKQPCRPWRSKRCIRARLAAKKTRQSKAN